MNRLHSLHDDLGSSCDVTIFIFLGKEVVSTRVGHTRANTGATASEDVSISNTVLLHAHPVIIFTMQSEKQLGYFEI